MTNEKDPNGIPAGELGAKLDDGKNRLGLVLGSFSNALWAVGEVGTMGAKKYCDHGWEHVPDGVNRYTDALLRHLMKELGGEQKDVDTTLLHAAHTAWNALARLELIVRAKKDTPENRLAHWIGENPELSARMVNNTAPTHVKSEIPERFR